MVEYDCLWAHTGPTGSNDLQSETGDLGLTNGFGAKQKTRTQRVFQSKILLSP